MTIDQIVHSHRGSAWTVKSLWDESRDDPRFAFRFIANSSAGAREALIELT